MISLSRILIFQLSQTWAAFGLGLVYLLQLFYPGKSQTPKISNREFIESTKGWVQLDATKKREINFNTSSFQTSALFLEHSSSMPQTLLSQVTWLPACSSMTSLYVHVNVCSIAIVCRLISNIYRLEVEN